MAPPPSSSSPPRALRGGSQLLGAKATRAPRLAEQLYTQIYKRITAGQFPVNSKLPSEAELCEAFGVSRPVVREAVSRLHADGVQLIISVDCGIRGADAARRAQELGVDLIITDHHEPDAELPPALAVINPKRHDCSYPDKYLAGVGVALKLVQALCRRADREVWHSA